MFLTCPLTWSATVRILVIILTGRLHNCFKTTRLGGSKLLRELKGSKKVSNANDIKIQQYRVFKTFFTEQVFDKLVLKTDKKICTKKKANNTHTIHSKLIEKDLISVN